MSSVSGDCSEQDRPTTGPIGAEILAKWTFKGPTVSDWDNSSEDEISAASRHISDDDIEIVDDVGSMEREASGDFSDSSHASETNSKDSEGQFVAAPIAISTHKCIF